MDPTKHYGIQEMRAIGERAQRALARDITDELEEELEEERDRQARDAVKETADGRGNELGVRR